MRISLVTALISIALVSCNTAVKKAGQEIVVEPISFSAVADGKYRGGYTVGDFTFVVELLVANERLESITILQNQDSKYASKAENITRSVIEKQSLEVDAISGATSSSRVLLKAMERGLSKGVEQ